MSKTLSNHLYELIFSLSSSEKRYVKLFMTKHIGKENQLSLKLFDLILKKEGKSVEYIEEKIIFTKHASRLKNYLYDIVIKALEDYHVQKSVNITVRRKINQIEILYNKALYKQAVTLADKTLKLSKKIDNQVYIIETINWYMNALKTFEGKRYQAKYDKLQKIQNEAINKLSVERKYLNLSNKGFILTKKSGLLQSQENLNKFNEIINNPLLSEEVLTNSFISTRCFHSIWANYHYATNNYKEEHKCLYQIIKLYEDYPLRKDTDQYNYITYLNNYAVGCSRNKDWNQAQYYFNKLSAISPYSNQIEIKIFEYLSCNYLNLLIENVDLNKMKQELSTIELGLKKYDSKITPLFKKIILFNLCYAYFLLENYKKAQYYNFIIVNEKEDSFRSDVYLISRIIQFILHYKLKNIDLYESFYNALKYLFEQKNINYDLYNSFLTFIKQIIHDDDIMVFKDYKEELVKIIEVPKERKLLSNFNILSWIESEIKGVSMAECLKTYNTKFS